MRESIGYTVTINIITIFITIVFAFLCAILVYFKSNKASNIIRSSIEKYEGYNNYAINEINESLSSLGYNKSNISCSDSVALSDTKDCLLVSGKDLGYCVYYCNLDDGYYFYKIKTYMYINIPIINDILNIPIYSNTNRLYSFSNN